MTEFLQHHGGCVVCIVLLFGLTSLAGYIAMLLQAKPEAGAMKEGDKDADSPDIPEEVSISPALPEKVDIVRETLDTGDIQVPLNWKRWTDGEKRCYLDVMVDQLDLQQSVMKEAFPGCNWRTLRFYRAARELLDLQITEKETGTFL